MKRNIIRLTALLLIVSTMLSVPTLASASNIIRDDENEPDVQICASDLTDPSLKEDGVTVTKLFSVTANGVYGLHTTRNAEKYFTKNSMASLGGTHIRFSGKLTNSTGGNDSIKIGICYYDTLHGVYESIWSHTLDSGESFAVDSFSAKISDLSVNASRYCYVYVKNLTSNGTSNINGTFNVYYSCE